MFCKKGSGQHSIPKLRNSNLTAVQRRSMINDTDPNKNLDLADLNTFYFIYIYTGLELTLRLVII